MTLARKTITATLAAITLGVAMLASAAPASAGGFGYHHHRHWGPGFGIAAGALALGAIAAAPAYYGDCYVTRRPVRNYYGNVIGWRRVRVCD